MLASVVLASVMLAWVVLGAAMLGWILRRSTACRSAARSTLRLALAGLVLLAGCSRPPAPVAPAAAAEAPAEDHWETVLDVRLASPERCATGPFEVTLPARDVAWGRRVVFEVYGPRGMEISNRLDTPDMRSQWGIAIPVGRGDHTRCRAGEGGGVAAGTPGAATPGASAGEPARAGFEERVMEILDAPSASLPQLVPYEGELPSTRVQVGANAWLPHGDPWYYADDLWTARMESDHGGSAWRLRFWFPRPADLEGVVIRVRDELLVPDLPEAEYRARFAARVRDADAMRAEHQAEVTAEYQRRDRERAEHCAAHPEEEGCEPRHYGPMPPPPRAEERPPAPGPDVDWVPGYWSWVESERDFLWVGGTYVVRAPEVVAPPVATAPPVETAPPVATAPARAAPEIAVAEAQVEAVAPVQLDARIPAQPAPRAETIPPPPRVIGALWVPGSWSLRGRAWAWTPGRWVVPPARGARPRAPAVVEREGVRIYFPGGWVEVR